MQTVGMKVLRLQTKMNLLFSLVIILLGIGLGYSIYFSAVELIRESIGIKAENIVSNISNDISADELQKVTERTLLLKEQKGEATEVMSMPEYLKIREQLWDYKRIYNMKYLYIMAKAKNGEMMYVVDAFPLDYNGPKFSKPGDIEMNKYDLLEAAFTEEKAFFGELTYDNKWGANLAAYVPIFNSEKELIGVLGIDLEAGDIYGLMAKYRLRIIVFTAFAVIASILISFLLIHLVTARLKSLVGKVKKVQEGDYRIKFDEKVNDEFGELSAAFDDMVSVLYDQNLSINKTLTEISRTTKIQELKQRIIDNIKEVISVDIVEVLEIDSEKLAAGNEKMFPFCDSSWLNTDCLKDLKNGYVTEFKGIYTVMLGTHGNMWRILMINAQKKKLNQREKYTIGLLARYIAVFYENLSLVDELTNKIISLKNRGNTPVWMNKLFLQISEKERKRLAADLHDDVLQSVIKTKKYVSNLLCSKTASVENLNIQLKKIETELEDSIRLIRETCNELLPSFLMEKGITGAVKGLVERAQIRHNKCINFEAFNITTELEYEEILTVYRIVQELINNAIAHSKATQIDLMLTQKESSFVIYYNDNGVGMDLNTGINTEKHFGLNGIKERIKLLNGRVTCCSNIGEGFELSCEFPIKQRIAC